MKGLFTTIILFITSLVYSQCIIDVVSTNGYTVHIELDVVSVNVPSTCPDPNYNYSVNIDHDVTFIGGGGSLWTLQAKIACDDDTPFFNLPNNGGVGSVVSATSTRDLIVGDCGTATPTILNCDDIVVEIHGPGISSRFVTCSSALPIELLYFDAELENETNVLLTWATVSEKDNDFFSIERSVNGISYETIGTVDGSGNSLSIIEYEYIDYSINSAYYYRVKQTDYDGEFDFTPIIYVGFVDTELKIEYIVDNIFFNNVNLVNFSIYSMNGVTFENYENVKPNHIVDVSNYPTGVYIIRAIDVRTGKQEIFKFLKD